jgi:flagellar protein FliO/FliZ
MRAPVTPRCLATAAGAAAAVILVPARAADAAAPQLFSGAYLAQVLGSLLLVFLCLFAVIYMLRRFNRIGAVQGMPLRILGSASVGTREKIVLVEAGREQLLIGVAQGSVRTLHVLPEPIAVAEPGSGQPDFAQILRAANPLGGRS